MNYKSFEDRERTLEEIRYVWEQEQNKILSHFFKNKSDFISLFSNFISKSQTVQTSFSTLFASEFTH
jgi:hypothetical protein